MNETDLPTVTVQLPLFNEPYVVEALLEKVAAFTYPKDLFEIQVLDDSTDETTAIVAKKIKDLSARGVVIHHIRRNHRQGFKAGALHQGMKTARGSFIAIFDADFLPPEDFLLKVLPYFKDPEIGLVQTRLEFINRDASLLTRIQYFLHNVMDTTLPNRSDGEAISRFRGTGGIWRREAIEEAGGWQGDTLTEDLDLSLRAQMIGWQVLNIETTVSPGLLPEDLGSFKTQQFRWTRGGAQTARKLNAQIRQSSLSLKKKVEALLSLFDFLFFIAVFLAGVFNVLVFVLRPYFPDWSWTLINGLFAFFVFISILIAFNANVLKYNQDKSWLQRLRNFILIYLPSLFFLFGFSFLHTRAAAAGYFGKKKTPFIRTLKGPSDCSQSRIRELFWAEGMISALFALITVISLLLGNMALIPCNLFYTLSFGAVFLYSVFSALSGPHKIEKTLQGLHL